MIAKSLVLFGIMFLFLCLRFPVFAALGMAVGGIFFLFPGTLPVAVIGQGFISGMNSYNFCAILFYFLLGEIMNYGSLSDRLVDFGKAAIGHIRGSLSHINILASMVFAGVSGSAVADTAAIGSLMIPMMKKDGYDGEYSAAVTGASSCIGPIIPPSGGLVLMGVYLSCSINKLFLGGMIPGLLMGVFQLAVSYVISAKRQYPKGEWRGWRFFLRTAKSSFFAFMLPVIVVYCLIAGIGTVVEIGAIAVVCAVIICAFIYRGMNFKQFCTCFARAAMMAAKVLPCLAAAGVFTWIISSIGVSASLQGLLMGATSNPTLVLALMLVVLLLFGMILDVNVIQMVIVPAMVPVVRAFGIDPIQFGVVGMLVCQMGLITPPVGTLIYITASIAESNPLKVAKELFPFIVALVVLVGLMTVFPAITTWFPNFVYGAL